MKVSKYNRDSYQDKDRRRRSSHQSPGSIDEDDMIASTALSFGGVASSKVVAGKPHEMYSPSENGKGPPPPPPFSGNAATAGRRGPPPLPPSSYRKGPPPPPPSLRANGNNSKIHTSIDAQAMGYVGTEKMSMMGSAMQGNEMNESDFDSSDLEESEAESLDDSVIMGDASLDHIMGFSGSQRQIALANQMETKGTKEEVATKSNSLEKVAVARKSPPPHPPKSKAAKTPMPASKSRSFRRSLNQLEEIDDDHLDPIKHDIMGYAREGRKSQVGNINLLSKWSSSGDEKQQMKEGDRGGHSASTPSLRQSFTKGYSTPTNPEFSHALEDRYAQDGGDDVESRRSEPSTVRSDGGSRRTSRRNHKGYSNGGHSRHRRSSSSQGKGKKSPSKLSAVAKLEVAQARLKNGDGNGGKLKKKKFIHLLESSIKDLQKMQQAVSVDDDDDDNSDGEGHHSYRRRPSSGGISEKSPSQKSQKSQKSRGSHLSRGRSTGGGSKSSHSRGINGRNRSRNHRSRGTSRGKSRGSQSRGSSRRDWDGGVSVATGASSGSIDLAPVPKEARNILSRVRGSEALPREAAVSSVVRRLVSKIDREGAGGAMGEGYGGSCCVAIVSSNGDEYGARRGVAGEGGEGKSTIAALACVRGDVRTRYHRGIAWLDMDHGFDRDSDDERGLRPRGGARLDFESYSRYLSDICRQVGVKPQQLRLSPVVRAPGGDAAVSELQRRGHMREAYARMGKLLTALQKQRKSNHSKRDNGQHTSVLLVLDDVVAAEDIEWFQFRQGGGVSEGKGAVGSGGGGPCGVGEQVNDLLVTSRLTDLGGVSGTITIALPPLEIKEAVRLLLTESDLPSNHPMASNRVARGLVEDCLMHPLTIKFAGRWLSLKRVTSGGQKGIDEILGEVKEATEGVASVENSVNGGKGNNNSKNSVDVLYSLLNRAMSPLVKGKETKIVRLCFAALVSVFHEGTRSMSVPLEIANDFFLKVVENESQVLSREDTFFQSNGRQSAKLVPEILGALGVFNITQHTTQVEGSERKESSVQIDHDLVRRFGNQVRDDEAMHRLVKNAERSWNEAYVQSYLRQRARCLWDDIQPDRSRRYALERMPAHMIRAGMLDDADALLLNESFVRGRFWSLGWTEGTRAHVEDAEALCHSLGRGLPAADAKLADICVRLEAVLMEEVARESGGPKGRCSTLEAGRCLHEISVSLARFGLWDEASRFCDSCVELVESNLGPSELVASLLFNSSVMHAEANELDLAEKIIGDCLDMRVKTCGTESILYVRALCQLGDILSVSSDYSAAESCFNKSIGILKVLPARYHLDFGVALYKLGRNQHRRGGYMDEALHCYEEALEFEKDELGPHHIFTSSVLTHMGDILLDKEDVEQAKHTFKEALDVLTEADLDTSSSLELKIKFALVGGKLLSIAGQSDNCIEKYQQALILLRKHTPSRKRKIAQVSSMIAAEYEKLGNYPAAEKLYEESVNTMKSVFGSSHLDIAETLVNLSGVKSACEHNAQATECLEESIDIQKSRLGDCEECVITLNIFGAHLRAIKDFEKAELAFNDAMRILHSLEGDHDLLLVDSLLGMADLMTAMLRYDDAMKYFNQCLEIQESVFGEKHEDTASTLYAMGLMQLNAGNYSDALVLFAKSLVMRVELHGEDHPAVADVYDMMGFVEAKQGDLDTALRRLEDGLKVRKSLGDRLKEADTLVNIGNLRRERKEFDLSLQIYDDCLDIMISECGRYNQSVADILMALGNVQSDMENPQKALSHYREALEILISAKGPNDASVALTFQKVGMVQYRAGNLESGRAFLDKAVELYRQGGERYESDLITPLFVIGNIHDMLEQEEEAHSVWNNAFDMIEKVGEQADPEVHRVLTQLLHAG